MRVEIQFCELKILALEKSCEFKNLPVANTKSFFSLQDIYKYILKALENKIKHLWIQTRCQTTCTPQLSYVSSANHSDVNFLTFL